MYHLPMVSYQKTMQIAAARRAIGIVNKLKPGQFRACHASRVFTNLNRLRSH